MMMHILEHASERMIGFAISAGWFMPNLVIALVLTLFMLLVMPGSSLQLGGWELRLPNLMEVRSILDRFNWSDPTKIGRGSGLGPPAHTSISPFSTRRASLIKQEPTPAFFVETVYIQGYPHFLGYWPNNLGLKTTKGPNSKNFKFNHFLYTVNSIILYCFNNFATLSKIQRIMYKHYLTLKLIYNK